MRNISKKILTLVISTFIFTSCGQIAKDTLSGQYKGKVTYVYKYSQLNMGIEDKQKSEECFSTVFADSKSPSLVVTSVPDNVPINIKITGFKLLTNGASFNIEQQVIYEKETPINLQGNPIFTDTEGNKSDGCIDDSDKLTFACTGIIKINENGFEYDLPIEAFYEMTKIQK